MGEAEEGRRRRREGEGERRSDRGPVEVLGEEVIRRVMELLDAHSVARCTTVTRAWCGVTANDCLWALKVHFLPCYCIALTTCHQTWARARTFAGRPTAWLGSTVEAQHDPSTARAMPVRHDT